jgi:hypothetical protein
MDDDKIGNGGNNGDVRGTPQIESKHTAILTQEPTTEEPYLLIGTPMIKTDGRNRAKKRKTTSPDGATTENDDPNPKYVRTADEAVAALWSHPSFHNNEEATNDTNKSHNRFDVNVRAVLHGEERYEILSVPTCMYQEPYPTSIWIDATNRMVRIKGGSQHQHLPKKDMVINEGITDPAHPTQSTSTTHHHSHEKRTTAMSPHSTIMTSSTGSHSSFLSLQHERNWYTVDEATILQSLRTVVGQRSLSQQQQQQQRTSTTSLMANQGHNINNTPTTTKFNLTPKERILRAVLMKWNVVTEE